MSPKELHGVPFLNIEMDHEKIFDGYKQKTRAKTVALFSTGLTYSALPEQLYFSIFNTLALPPSGAKTINVGFRDVEGQCHCVSLDFDITRVGVIEIGNDIIRSSAFHSFQYKFMVLKNNQDTSSLARIPLIWKDDPSPWNNEQPLELETVKPERRGGSTPPPPCFFKHNQ